MNREVECRSKSHWETRLHNIPYVQRIQATYLFSSALNKTFKECQHTTATNKKQLEEYNIQNTGFACHGSFCSLSYCQRGCSDGPGEVGFIELQFPFCCKCQCHRINSVQAAQTYLYPRSLKAISKGWLYLQWLFILLQHIQLSLGGFSFEI